MRSGDTFQSYLRNFLEEVSYVPEVNADNMSVWKFVGLLELLEVATGTFDTY